MLIEGRDLTLKRGGRLVLDRVSIAIAGNEIVTIVGPNGSGKTTLIRALIGAVTPDGGTVRHQPGLKTGYVPQRMHLDGRMPMTVARFLRLGGLRDSAGVEAALARVGAEGTANLQMANLSGGQFQRVLLAHALIGAPQLLVLDEPTQGLDQPGEAAFYALLATLRDETGTAILLVSHDLHVVMSRSDRVLCLNGHVCCEGTPDVVLAAPEYRALFGAGTHGALALYRHEHDHSHAHDHHHHDHDTGADA